MNHRYDDPHPGRDWRDREHERYRDEEREAGREQAEPYGQREPYNTSGSGGSTYGSSGYGPYRGEGQPQRSAPRGSYGGREEFGRSRWGGPTDYGYRGESRYSESQYGQRRPGRDAYGQSGGRYQGQYPEGRDAYGSSGSRYGSGDFGFEGGRRGEPQFGEGPFGDSSESPRYFGSGYYGEGGAHYTGGYPRGAPQSSGSDIDYGYGYERSRSDSWRGSERSGLTQRLFKRGPKGYQRSDERLREDISERLMQAEDIDSSDVTVNVTGGKVTLDGTVPSRYMKHYIEDLVDVCPGVQDIDNRVRVGSASNTGATSTSTTTSLGSSTSNVSGSTSRRRE